MKGMGIGVMALVLVLSVFNGFESLVKQLYGVLDPEIRITAAEGKVFEFTDEDYEFIKSVNGVEEISMFLEERVLVRYRDEEYLALVRGVDSRYEKVSDLKNYIVRGEYALMDMGAPRAILGAGVQRALNIQVEQSFHNLVLYVPNRTGRISSINPDQAFNRRTIAPSSVFSIQQEFDNQYIFVPVTFMQEVLNYNEKTVTALDIKLISGYNQNRVANQLRQLLSDEYVVQTRYQLNETLYSIMQTEKWVVYAILTLILIIAAFNIVGSLSMLVLEKKHDIAILQAMGATPNTIRNIFIAEGLIISLGGALAGSLLAILIAFAQIHFELIKISSSGSFVVSAYPVELQLLDFVLISVTVIFISILASWFPAVRASRMKNLAKAE
ncbi:MAG: ABC transporter permease [Chitinophagaceae bacterium]|nr:MAG: ABC transporter permease [Chitinophagaceae bacterium]